MNHTNTELFERYLAGELSPDERQQLEEALEKNPELKAEFTTLTEINTVLSDKQLTDFRLNMKSIHNKHFKTTTGNKFISGRIIAAAASVIVLLGISYYFLIYKSQQSDEKLLFSTFYPDMISLKGTPNNNPAFSEAVNAYNMKQFSEAVTLFEKLAKTDSINSLYSFNLAMAHLGAEDYVRAEKLFDEIIKSNNSLVVDNAEWFLAICYYKTGRKTNAIALFKKMASDTTHFKAGDAKKALELIE
jgi:tetratricopeptide (TPR) repeat protein